MTLRNGSATVAAEKFIVSPVDLLFSTCLSPVSWGNYWRTHLWSRGTGQHVVATAEKLSSVTNVAESANAVMFVVNNIAVNRPKVMSQLIVNAPEVQSPFRSEVVT